MEKPRLKKPRSLEDLTPSDREMCQLLKSLGVVFDTAKLIKLEFFAKALKRFQDQEMVESLGGNVLQDHVAQGLGDFLVASSLALSKAQDAQDLRPEMVKLKEELTLKTKVFSNRETAMY